MEQFLIYLWAISENVGCALFVFGIIIFIAGIIQACGKDCFKTFCVAAGVTALLVFFAVLIPTKQDLALIFTYPYIKSGVENVVQSEQMDKLNKMSKLYLDKIIKDLEAENASK